MIKKLPYELIELIFEKIGKMDSDGPENAYKFILGIGERNEFIPFLSRYKYYIYNNINSLRYLNDDSYRAAENRAVICPSTQIYLNIKSPVISVEEINTPVHTLNLAGSEITNINNLTNVYSLVLSSTSVSDISCLEMGGVVNNINLRHTQVHNIKGLKNIHTVNLAYTPVIDLSPLNEGSLYSLDLTATKLQKSIVLPTLPNLHTLNVSNTCISTVRNIQNIQNLNISWCKHVKNIKNYIKIHTLNLSNCANLKNISAFKRGTVRDLNLTKCEKITDFRSVCNIHILNLSNTNIIDVKYLKYVYSLNLSKCKKIKEFKCLANSRKLKILNLSYTNISIFDLNYLRKNDSLDLKYCFSSRPPPRLTSSDNYTVDGLPNSFGGFPSITSTEKPCIL
jgi:hypothetical protein